jgi:hypothetical protein
MRQLAHHLIGITRRLTAELPQLQGEQGRVTLLRRRLVQHL